MQWTPHQWSQRVLSCSPLPVTLPHCLSPSASGTRHGPVHLRVFFLVSLRWSFCYLLFQHRCCLCFCQNHLVVPLCPRALYRDSPLKDEKKVLIKVTITFFIFISYFRLSVRSRSLQQYRPADRRGHGVVVTALASHQCDPGLITARCHMWFEFVVGCPVTPASSLP